MEKKVLDFNEFLNKYKQVKNNNFGRNMWQILPTSLKAILVISGFVYIVLFAFC